MVVPVFVRAVLQLGGEHRPAALREKQQSERRRDVRVLFAVSHATNRAGQAILQLDHLVGTLTIPIAWMAVGVEQKPPGRHAADALQAVEIIEVILVVKTPLELATRHGVLGHGPFTAQPLETALDGFGGVLVGLFSATGDLAFGDARVGLIEFAVGDDDRCDASAGHASCAGDSLAVLRLEITPRTIGRRLSRQPIVETHPPHLVAHADACPLGFVQREHGELRVRIVGADRATMPIGVTPRALVLAVANLRLFEQLHVPLDMHAIAPGVCLCQHHDLQADRVGTGRLDVLDIFEGILDGFIVRLQPRVE